MDWKIYDSIMNRSKNKYKFYFGIYEYYDCVKSGIADKIPKPHLGWGKRAVQMRSNKTHFDCFENDTLGLNDILKKYRVLEAFDKVKEDVLVAGCGFLALAYNRVMPFTAEEATGTYSWREQNLEDGIAVFARESKPHETRYHPNAWIKYNQSVTEAKDKGRTEVTTNVTGRPLIGLLTYNATTKRPFGHSVLSLPARDAIIDASRTVRQAMIAAHYYNSKVDVILGADNETPIEKIKREAGDVLKIGTNGDGHIPQIGQFAQHAMAPFNDTVLTAARNFCSATNLTLVNLGIATDAPQSTEALEIVSDDLKDDILAWQEELGQQLKYYAVTLWMYDNNVEKLDDNLQNRIDSIMPVWKPVYRADVSKFGDGLTKIAQTMPDIVMTRSIWRNLGLESKEIDSIIASATRVQ